MTQSKFFCYFVVNPNLSKIEEIKRWLDMKKEDSFNYAETISLSKDKTELKIKNPSMQLFENLKNVYAVTLSPCLEK